jgi:hypothetical protein
LALTQRPDGYPSDEALSPEASGQPARSCGKVFFGDEVLEFPITALKKAPMLFTDAGLTRTPVTEELNAERVFPCESEDKLKPRAQDAQLKSKWKIDQTLESLIGTDIRLAVRNFSPRRGDLKETFVPVTELFLPDNSKPAGLRVLFEGNLQSFHRQIGVVFAALEAPKLCARGSDGFIPFRKNLAVFIKGPAIVELDFPFFVERLPSDDENYWRDLRMPRAQFEFCLCANEPTIKPAPSSFVK